MGCSALIGAALSLAGAGTSEVASLETKNKMNGIMAANQAQQNALQQKSQGVFQNSLSQSTPQAAQQQVQQGADAYKNAATQAQAVPLGEASSALTNQDKSANAARAGLNSTAMANFEGYNQYGVNQGLKDQQANSQIGAINNQSGFINSLLPSELGAAQNSYAGLSSFGSLLGSAGNLVGAFGSLGALKPSMTPLGSLGQYSGTTNMLNGIGRNAMQGNWLTNGLYSSGGGLF